MSETPLERAARQFYEADSPTEGELEITRQIIADATNIEDRQLMSAHSASVEVEHDSFTFTGTLSQENVDALRELQKISTRIIDLPLIPGTSRLRLSTEFYDYSQQCGMDFTPASTEGDSPLLCGIPFDVDADQGLISVTYWDSDGYWIGFAVLGSVQYEGKETAALMITDFTESQREQRITVDEFQLRLQQTEGK